MKIKLPGMNREIGIRMVKEAAGGCIPAIEGLFLLDDNQEWKATSKDVPLANMISFIPVRLVGNTCGEEVTWNAVWEPSAVSGGRAPVFGSAGSTGILGFELLAGWGNNFNCYLQQGVATISASCAGVTYGPVTISFLWGDLY